MPTSRRRHAITETPLVEAILDELRGALGGARLDLSELVVLGARAKLAELRTRQDQTSERRRGLADVIRAGEVPVDPVAADEVRRRGWFRA